ncbi:uncharacterized protein EV420DRAFT_1278538 [Desarmillaria tabescens]|uniref:Uncharacterized protein n=1 Tax=Armillaria tabescens TaxID=1929756 RepID=A0AA39JGY8_ARMTA|nr:uncharacterized protein EV420DRAFT_1278538 [Desarmillaria tabescens]KAK0441765.1 hypothetical protein EV420DRAFT_1278538 [Desarmillaria tabescens]
MSGNAGANSQWCTVCNCPLQERNTCYHLWTKRNVGEMRKYAYTWQDATTTKEREEIFNIHRVRWSELWRLPYWDLTHMLVIDSMHCILLGLVCYHCRYVLGIDAKKAEFQSRPPPAFLHDWVLPHKDVPEPYCVLLDHECKQVTAIHKLLMTPLKGEGSITEAQLSKQLLSKNAQPLKFVGYTLGTLKYTIHVHEKAKEVVAKAKSQLVALLVEWVTIFFFVASFIQADHDLFSQRKKKDLSANHDSTIINLVSLCHIQTVIKETTTPSWINSVPANYGEASAGSLKADEWRILSTVYLPIALVTLWGDNNRQDPGENSRSLQVLNHTMALFQAVGVVCRYSMNSQRAETYCKLIKEWVDGLLDIHPHTWLHHT